MTKERQGPTLSVRFSEMSALYRVRKCLTTGRDQSWLPVFGSCPKEEMNIAFYHFLTGTSFAPSEVKPNLDPHIISTERLDMNPGYNDGRRVASSLINRY